MTREEAIEVIKDIYNYTKWDTYTTNEARDMAIEALKNNYTDFKNNFNADAVSRQAVNTLIDELARAISDERCCIPRGRSTATIMQDILDLTSVTPTRPKGHWIEDEEEMESYCSECGEENPSTLNTDFCPNCGARMESEVNNEN